MLDRYGGMLGRTLLGTGIPATRTYGKVDGTETGSSVPDGWQARQEPRGFSLSHAVLLRKHVLTVLVFGVGLFFFLQKV